MGRYLTLRAHISHFGAIGLVLLAASCTEGRKQEYGTSPAVPERSPLISTKDLPNLPTKPDAGIDDWRVVPLTPEENNARVRKNTGLPIVFGESAAGISMKTTLVESMDILSDPYGTAGDMVFYREGIRVKWNTTGDQKPNLIIVDDDYQGTLAMPGTIGSIKVGAGFKKFFAESDTSLAPGTSLLKQLGRFFMKESAEFDCLAKKYCSMSDEGDSFYLIYPAGFLIFGKTPELPLKLMVFRTPPPPPTEPLKDAILLGKGAGGITLGMTQAQVAQKLGKPSATAQDGREVYDNGNLIVIYKADANSAKSVIAIAVIGDYLGGLTASTKLGTLKVGQSLASYFTATVNGTELAKELGRFAEGKDANYDCIASKTCEVTDEDTSHVVTVKGGQLQINHDDKKIAAIVVAAQ